MSNKPSERFCKHGFLLNEQYNQEIHMYGNTIEKRCQNFYTPEEIARMKSEIKVAECGICLENLTDANNCMCCTDGHKFHNTCLNEYWATNPSKNQFCPTTNTIPIQGWVKRCININDIHSGGKKSRKSKKYSYIYMPNSKKRFSKKRRIVKKIKKNTRKYKKRTPRRKYRKSSRRLRFFGGVGEDKDCAICLESLTNGEPIFTTNCQHNFHLGCIRNWCAHPEGRGEICTCPFCRAQLNPSPNQTPNQNPNPNPPVRLYRVQLFRHVRNPETGENDRVPVSIRSLTMADMGNLRNSFINRFLGSNNRNFLFRGDYQLDPDEEEDPYADPDPYGYILLRGPNANNVEVIEGDMDIDSTIYVHYPPTDVDSVTITRVHDIDV